MNSPEDDSRAQGYTARLAHLVVLPARQSPRVLAAVAVRCHGMCTFAGICIGDDQSNGGACHDCGHVKTEKHCPLD